VLKTLIRCHFSPPSSTGQQYLYSGSEDGRVHIWNLDGSVARVIDVGQALSKATADSDLGDNGWGLRAMGFGRGGRRRIGVNAVVRDVSWHPYEGVLVCLFDNALITGEFFVD
jgi:DDB1- and CUL4-associated factor 11